MKTSRLLGWTLACAAVLVLSACAVLQLPAFGQLPQGARLAAIEASPNYRDGAFQNAVPTYAQVAQRFDGFDLAA